MDPEVKKRVKKLYTKYAKVFDVAYEAHDAVTLTKFYLANTPKKYALKMADVKRIKKDPHLEIFVIEPQSYENVSVLNAWSEAIIDDHFGATGALATTGSGEDKWIKVTAEFADWFDKMIAKMEKANAKKVS